MMMMDPTEFLVIKNYADVFPQLDEIIRKALRQEHVPYSRGQAPTVSAGSLKVPRMFPESLNNNNEPFETQRQNASFEHKIMTGYFNSALKSCQRPGHQVKKRKALPYEKLCYAEANNFQPAFKDHNHSFKAPKTCTKLSNHNSVTTGSGNCSAITEVHNVHVSCQTVNVCARVDKTTNGGFGVKVAVTTAQSTQKSHITASDQNSPLASQSKSPSNNIVNKHAASSLVNHHASQSPSSDLIEASSAISSAPSNISVTKLTSSGIASQMTSSGFTNVAPTALSSVIRDSSSQQSHGLADTPLPTSADTRNSSSQQSHGFAVKPPPTSADIRNSSSQQSHGFADKPPPTSADIRNSSSQQSHGFAVKPPPTSADIRNSSLQQSHGFTDKPLPTSADIRNSSSQQSHGFIDKHPATSADIRNSSSQQSHGFAVKPPPTSADIRNSSSQQSHGFTDKPPPTSADIRNSSSQQSHGFTDKPPPASADIRNSSSQQSHGFTDKPPPTSADDSSFQKKTCVHENNGFYEHKRSNEHRRSEDSGSNLKATPIEIGTLDEKEMVKIIETLKKAQNVFDTFPSEKMEELLESQEEFLKRQELMQKSSVKNESSPGDMRSLIIDQIVKYFETKILETVRFAKRIPGFLDLPRDDQANLIRESRNESDLISDMRGVNAKNKVITSLDGHHFSLEDLKTVYPEETLQCFYIGGQKALKLNPSAEEEALLRAISITFADRCELKCKEKVEDIQNRLISCLLYVIKNQGDPEGVRLGQIMNFLIFCRTMTENELKVTKSIILESEKHASNPFVQEVL